MEGRRLGLGLTAALVVLLVAPGVASPPKSAREWLGSWKTNEGDLYVHDLYRAKSPAPDARGRPQYYWRMEAGWDRPGHGYTAITGAATGRGFDTFAGCFVPSNAPDRPNCAPVLIFRKGDRITGGYWKACGVPENCKTHHPWRGEKKAGRWTVGFRFRQRGRPEGRQVIVTQTGGAGALISPTRIGDGDTGAATHDSRVFHLDEIRSGPDLSLTIDLDGGRLDLGDRRAEILVGGRVIHADAARCRGARMSMWLRDGRGGVPDRIELLSRSNSCDLHETWISKDPHRVSVHIDAPHESP